MNTDDVSSWNFNVLWWLLWCSFLCVWQSTSCLSLHLSREGLLSCTQAYTIWWWKYKRGTIWIHCLELYCLFLECIQIQRCNVWPSSLTEYWFGLDLGCILYYLHLTSSDVSITFSVFQVVVKMGILVIKIATTFIMKCMNVIAIKATSSVATDTAALVSIQVSPFTDICHLTYAKFPTFIWFSMKRCLNLKLCQRIRNPLFRFFGIKKYFMR